MTATHLLVILMSACGAARAQDSGEPVRTLSEAYSRALAVSETIAINRQAIVQAEALYRKALGASFPELFLRNDTTWTGTSTAGQGRPSSDGAIRLSQTGLTGYREIYAVKSAKASADAKEYLRLRAEQLLLGDVAAAFFGLLQSQENHETTKRLQEFAGKRLEELRERVRVGRNREADAIAQEVQLSTFRSQLEESDRQTGARGDLLRYLTRVENISPKTEDAAILAPEKPLSAYLARIDARPDVAAERKNELALLDAAKAARADHLPSLNLLGNWYPYRSPAKMGSRWDAGASVVFPLWSWGSRQAGIEASSAAAEAERLVLQGLRRQAELDIRNSFRDAGTARRQLEIQRRAVELAEKDYAEQTRDEKRGLVTALEVLQSLDRLNLARLSRSDAILQARLAALRLEISAGAKPGEMDLR